MFLPLYHKFTNNVTHYNFTHFYRMVSDNNIHMVTTNKFWLGEEQQIIRVTTKHCFEAIQVLISVNVEPLDPDVEFPYLGRTVAYNNSDWAGLYHNLRKAQRRWGIVGKVVTKTGTTVQSQGILYKEIVQLVLLYGGDSWVVTGAMLKIL